MVSRRSILKATLGLCSCGACATAGLSILATSARAEPIHIPGRGYDMRFVGAQHDTIANGKIAALIDLRSLAKTPHLYAIGPIEQLRGEVTIIDSRPSAVARRSEQKHSGL